MRERGGAGTRASALERALQVALGARVLRVSPLAGGDINEAYAVELEGRPAVFVKTNAEAPPGLFAAEARGLAWLAAPGVVRVPEVIAVSSADAPGPAYLVLELIRAGARRASFDEELGRGLALLHRAAPAGFGLADDNYIGRLPQRNAPHPQWAAFWREERLLPQLELARRAGLIPAPLGRECEQLCQRLEALLGPEEPPARLHGDLWAGNVHGDAQGGPVLIDPAVYGGHREVDLAMMDLFGGFGPRVLAAYAEVYPLAPGRAERVPLYQLYPLLVHVNLFGGGYVASVARAVSRYR